MLDRGSVELLSPVPRPESIRDFMSFEQHAINCLRRLSMPRWRGVLDEWMEGAFGRRATLAYRMNRAWYERPLLLQGESPERGGRRRVRNLSVLYRET